MSIQTQFAKFNEALYMSREEPGYKVTKQKDADIFESIKTAFSNAGYPVIETFMQGSFAKEVITAIKNPGQDYDIDRAIVIDEHKAPTDPLGPKRIIEQVLRGRGFQKPEVKRPCVTADYSSRKRHIDYVVYSKDAYGNYKIAYGKGGVDTKWADADPKGLIRWITDTSAYHLEPFKQRDQFRRLVRYLKHWRNQTFSENVADKIFSIALTVMVKEQFRPNIKDDLSALINTVSCILHNGYFRQDTNSRYRVYVSLPKHPGHDIFNHKVGTARYKGSDLDTGTQFRNQLSKLLTALENAAKQPNDIEAGKVLKSVFGSAFTGLAAASASFPSKGAEGTTQGAK